MKNVRMSVLSALLFSALWGPHLMADDQLMIQAPLSGGSPSGLDENWRLITDTVMGGTSSGTLTTETIDGRTCLRMRGDVSLKNNGGFIQAALDIVSTDAADASAFEGVTLEVFGNDEEYNLHLRSQDVWMPWQSYRASFLAPARWHTVKLPFDTFSGYRMRKPLDLTRLKRIGIVAIGHEFSADLCIASVALYRSRPQTNSDEPG